MRRSSTSDRMKALDAGDDAREEHSDEMHCEKGLLFLLVCFKLLWCPSIAVAGPNLRELLRMMYV